MVALRMWLMPAAHLVNQHQLVDCAIDSIEPSTGDENHLLRIHRVRAR
jgi:hypothetical protein